MSDTAAPLFRLLCKDEPWLWGEEEEQFFHLLKCKLTEAPLLAMYDRTLPVKLACDASSYGLGVVLSHVYPDNTEKPIAFASRTLNKSEKNYSQLDKEALSIMFGIKKFNQYLFGRKFVLVTDNKALSHILHPNTHLASLAASRLVRWHLTLSMYDYEIELKSTKNHSNADMLSRLPLPAPVDEISVNAINLFQINILPISPKQLQQATMEDRVLKSVLGYLSSGYWPNENEITKELKSYYFKRDSDF